MGIVSKLKSSMLALIRRNDATVETEQTSITARITREQESWIQEKLSRGLYLDETDVVQDALRLLKVRDESSAEDDDFESSEAIDEIVPAYIASAVVGVSNSELMKTTCDVMKKLGLEGWHYHALARSRAFDNEGSSFDEIAPDLHFWFIDPRNQTHTFSIRMELLAYPVTLEAWLSARLEAKLGEIISFLNWYDRETHTVKINF